MQPIKENVIRLNQGTVYEDIQTFIDSRRSENTKRNYRRTIEDFFAYMGLDMSSLTDDDLQFKYADIVNYQQHLLKKYSKHSTVNNKITAIRSLFKFLQRNEHPINMAAFDVDHLPEYDVNGSGFFKDECEAMQVVKYIEEHLPNGQMKGLLLDVAAHTFLRVSDLLSLTPKHFKKDEEHDGWIVSVLNKKTKKKTHHRISDRLGEKVNTYVQEHKIKRTERLFKITDRQLNDDIKKALVGLGIDDDRKLTLHSFRKLGTKYELTVNKDLNAAKMATSHSSWATVLKYYNELQDDQIVETGYMMEKDIDLSVLDVFELPSEFMEILKGCTKGVQKEIVEKAKKWLEG